MGIGDASAPSRAASTMGRPSSTPGTLGVNDAACTLASGPLVLPLDETGCSEFGPHDFMLLYRHSVSAMFSTPSRSSAWRRGKR